MLFFAVVYTVEGVGQAKVGVVWQPLTWYLKEVQGWTPLQISAGLAVLDLPWIVKPLYGAISDFLPLFGYRRRSYLLLANAAAIAAFVWVAQEHAPAAIVLALLVTSIAMAISSTLCGALLVENGQRYNSNGAFVNQQWLWFNVALVLASLAGGALVQLLSPAGALHGAALVAAVAPLAVMAGLPLVRERRARLDPAGLRHTARAFAAAFRSRALWLVAVFLFFYYFSPRFGTPLYFYMTDRLAVLAGVHRRAGVGERGGLDRRRPAVPLGAGAVADRIAAAAVDPVRRAQHAGLSRSWSIPPARCWCISPPASRG